MSHFGVPIVFPHSGVVRAVSFRLPLLRNSSGTGCTALMAASTSLHQYYWAVFVFHPHQFSVWNDFFLPPAQHYFPAGDSCAHKHHWKSTQPDYSLIFSMNNWKQKISGLFHIFWWNLFFCVGFLSFLPLEAHQSLTFFKCIWTNGRHCCVAWQPDHSNNLFLI